MQAMKTTWSALKLNLLCNVINFMMCNVGLIQTKYVVYNYLERFSRKGKVNRSLFQLFFFIIKKKF